VTVRFVEAPQAPKPAGHYSQAVVHGGLVFVSGLLPIDAETREAPDGIEAQTRLALRHLESIVREAGSGLDRVLKVTIFLTDKNFWPQVNGIYAEVFGEHRPARAIIPIAPLANNYLIEIEAVAAAEA
jgi:2-iminobutanoate/2-iminopropanoate deaminase